MSQQFTGKSSLVRGREGSADPELTETSEKGEDRQPKKKKFKDTIKEKTDSGTEETNNPEIERA
jgi:hypothetical protein